MCWSAHHIKPCYSCTQNKTLLPHHNNCNWRLWNSRHRHARRLVCLSHKNCCVAVQKGAVHRTHQYYQYGDHYTSDCKKLKSFVVSAPKLATNPETVIPQKNAVVTAPFPDQNFHRTLAPFCPMRKDAIAQKQQKMAAKSQTYANIVKTTIKETTPLAGRTCH